MIAALDNPLHTANLAVLQDAMLFYWLYCAECKYFGPTTSIICNNTKYCSIVSLVVFLTDVKDVDTAALATSITHKQK
jgi:hypothetical protein